MCVCVFVRGCVFCICLYIFIDWYMGICIRFYGAPYINIYTGLRYFRYYGKKPHMQPDIINTSKDTVHKLYTFSKEQ